VNLSFPATVTSKIQVQEVFDCPTLKMKLPHSSETSVTLPVDTADIQSTLSRPVGGLDVRESVHRDTTMKITKYID